MSQSIIDLKNEQSDLKEELRGWLAEDEKLLALAKDLVAGLAKHGNRYVDEHSPFSKEWYNIKQILVVSVEKLEDGKEAGAEKSWRRLKRRYGTDVCMHDNAWIGKFPSGCKNPLYLSDEGEVHQSCMASGMLLHEVYLELQAKRRVVQDHPVWAGEEVTRRETNLVFDFDEFCAIVYSFA